MMKMHNECPSDRYEANYRRTNRNWIDVRPTLMDNLSVLHLLIFLFFPPFSSLNFQKFITVLSEKKKKKIKFLSRPDLIKNYNIYF